LCYTAPHEQRYRSGKAITYNCPKLPRGFFIYFMSNANERCTSAQRRDTGFFGGVMKTRFTFAVAIFCVALAPATVRSQSQVFQPQYPQSQEDQGACMADALAVCGQFIPDRERVASCLIANSSQISPSCRDAIKRFVPRTATR
jgi:hypothetical protein